jgi:hypothetical protein
MVGPLSELLRGSKHSKPPSLSTTTAHYASISRWTIRLLGSKPEPYVFITQSAVDSS